MPVPANSGTLLPDGTVLATAGSGAHCNTGGLPESDDDCGRSFIDDPDDRTWSETDTMTGVPRYGYVSTAPAGTNTTVLRNVGDQAPNSRFKFRL